MPLAVPNFSEGRDEALVAEIAEAGEAAGASVLDVHSDPDHHRSVVTLHAPAGVLAAGVAAMARVAVQRIDLRRQHGLHPRVGVLDVAPIVYLDDEERGAACAEALLLADLLAESCKLPVFLYGTLGGGRTRADLRRGGPLELARRTASGELRPDFGPPRLHPSAGAVLVAARPPLVAFNVELAPPAGLEQAREIAGRLREGGAEGLPGVRAIGLWLEERRRAQVSTNVEDHKATPLRRVVEVVGRHAQLAEAELVGLAPAAAFDGFPDGLSVRGRRTIEQALGSPPS